VGDLHRSLAGDLFVRPSAGAAPKGLAVRAPVRRAYPAPPLPVPAPRRALFPAS